MSGTDATVSPPQIEPFDARHVAGATGLLASFNEIGLLSPADVHAATRIADIVGVQSDEVRLAIAFAVRGPRLGHVFVDLATVAQTAAVESEEPVDLSTLPWPATDAWISALRASPLVGLDDALTDTDRPLRLLGTRLYLDRYWREERRVAQDLRDLAAGTPADAPGPIADGGGVLADGGGALVDGGGALAALFTDGSDDRQRLAAQAVLTHCFAVIAGGPGTGKTTTVARIVALLAEEAAARGLRQPLVALAAPTGKAAARLQEAVHEEAARLAVGDDTKAMLLSLRGSTLHRLLGWRPGAHSRFAHDRENRLPHDVVIVDETSMVSLSLMARLVEAIREDARLILVGDPGQLVSIEAGAVLGDIVGPAGGPAARSATPSDPQARRAARLGEGIVVLDRVHRFGGEIATLAAAIRAGADDTVIELLTDPRSDDVTWIPIDAGGVSAIESLEPVRELAVAAARSVIDAAREGAAPAAIEALAAFRILCAHRRGADGVSGWTARIERWLEAELGAVIADDRWYVGRPLLVTENDYELGLYNGDTGVIVARGDGSAGAVFERGGEIIDYTPTRLAAIDTVYAMTIHKSQGSQFDVAAVLLPEPTSRILSRELLYTAVTRARRRVLIAGSEETIRAAVGRPVARASGLRQRLWGEG